VLEAMSYGCVCISNDAPPMPEFFGDIALYYPTGDAQALGGALREGLTVDVLERKRRSRQRSLEFSWEHTVQQTISVLQRVAVSSGRRRRSATARGRGA
jgi:glycosyltransferase involved in cell wall biosynthesis